MSGKNSDPFNFASVLENELKKLENSDTVQPGEPPSIDLYMDQILTFLNSHLGGGNVHDEDKTLTKTMINNYTKKKLLPAPDKKKYSKEHTYLLTLIYYFKNILSIEEIQTLITPLTTTFFEGSSSISIEEIYKEIYELEMAQKSNLEKDIKSKTDIAKRMFPSIDDSEQQEYLRFLSIVSLLSFDVYMKKNIIENLIESYNKDSNSHKSSEKKES